MGLLGGPLKSPNNIMPHYVKVQLSDVPFVMITRWSPPIGPYYIGIPILKYPTKQVFKTWSLQMSQKHTKSSPLLKLHVYELYKGIYYFKIVCCGYKSALRWIMTMIIATMTSLSMDLFKFESD